MDYCPGCYRSLTEENPRCFSCAVGVQRERGRGAIRGGVVAVPLLIAAMLAHDARLCLAAAAISVVAVIVYTTSSRAPYRFRTRCGLTV